MVSRKLGTRKSSGPNETFQCHDSEAPMLVLHVWNARAWQNGIKTSYPVVLLDRLGADITLQEPTPFAIKGSHAGKGIHLSSYVTMPNRRSLNSMAMSMQHVSLSHPGFTEPQTN